MSLCRPKPMNLKKTYSLYDDLYKKMGKPKWLNKKIYKEIIETINESIAMRMLNGETVQLPRSMGAVETRKYKRRLKIENGRIIGQNSDINWYETLKWWKEEPDARERGDKIYFEHPWKYRLIYNKDGLFYHNRLNTGFKFMLYIREELAKRIRNGETDSIIGKT